MGKRAKPLQQQVELLIRRGMRVEDPERARLALLEIGFYRMSFYWFPFETRWPDSASGVHKFVDGTDFRDAFMLYAFDFKLRHALLKPLERIETAFRTYMIYHVSTRYPDSPAWFVDPHVVSATHANSFERAIYYPLKRSNPEIQLHHRRFPGDRFAPAWKTLEFVTLGTMCNLYDSLSSTALKHEVARHFGCDREEEFSYRIDIIRELRNICAHGNVLYSYRPAKVNTGMAYGRGQHRHEAPGHGIPRNLSGALQVVDRMLSVISERERNELRNNLSAILAEFGIYRGTADILHRISGFRLS